MKIKKFAHSCLYIEEAGVRFLTDPGSWNAPPEVEHLDAILITHTHQDHCSVEQVHELLRKHPDAQIITHEEVGKILTESNIPFTSITHGQTLEVRGIEVESCGTAHELIYRDVPKCQNTGFLIARKLFVPGDSLHDFPKTPVSVLALPTGGPWMRLSETIEYARKIQPKIVFPIHDAVYVSTVQREMVPRIVGGNLEAVGINFRDMAEGSEYEF